VIGPDLTIDFVRKSGKAIAEELSTKTKMQIRFKSNTSTKDDVYDYHLQNSGIWKLLVFLDEVGTVTVNGMSFDKLRELRNQIQDDKPLAAVRLRSMPAEEVAERLTLISGMRVDVTSGDPTKPISLITTKKTFSKVLKTIEWRTGIKMEATKITEN